MQHRRLTRNIQVSNTHRKHSMACSAPVITTAAVCSSIEYGLPPSDAGFSKNRRPWMQCTKTMLFAGSEAAWTDKTLFLYFYTMLLELYDLSFRSFFIGPLCRLKGHVKICWYRHCIGGLYCNKVLLLSLNIESARVSSQYTQMIHFLQKTIIIIIIIILYLIDAKGSSNWFLV